MHYLVLCLFVITPVVPRSLLLLDRPRPDGKVTVIGGLFREGGMKLYGCTRQLRG